MEGIEFEEPTPHVGETADFCNSIISRFSNFQQEEHQHLCVVLGAMSQELKEQKLPLTPVAYFGATCSSLERLSNGIGSPKHVIDALLVILALVLQSVPVGIVKRRREFLSELLWRITRSKELSVNGVSSGLKCVSLVLVIRENVEWSDVSQLFGILLAYMTDSRPKVRRQSHLCLHDALQSFQATLLLAPSSEGITKVLERFLLLAGGSKEASAEGPRGAQEVLYILDALKYCLPLMSSKFTTTILKYFKPLLELRQPVVTRKITDSLNALCLHPTKEIHPEALLDLLSSLAFCASSNETSVDSMTFTARLLNVGMKKAYLLNRQMCVVKLPVVFNALKDILASEHEEAIFASMETLKSLISDCLDENLIKQGVDQINVNVDARRSGPTIIEKVCSIVESLLDYRYASVWDMSFQVVSVMFDKLGEHSSYLLRGTLKSLSDMQMLPDENFPYRKQLHECVGSALGAMGPQMFLNLLPLKLDAEDLSEANVWLLPILKQHTVGACLKFFVDSILSMVRNLRQKLERLELDGRVFSSRSIDGLVYSLWSLLPSFCNYPLDTSQSFKDLERALCSALRECPEVRGLICSSLQILIQQNKRIVEGKCDFSDIELTNAKQRVMAHYTPQVAADNLNVLKLNGRELFSALSGAFLHSRKDDGGCLQSTINMLASISDKAVVSRFFKSTMQKLLKATRDIDKIRSSTDSHIMHTGNSSNEKSLVVLRGQLSDLAVSLLSGLNLEEIELLYAATSPALEEVEGLIQKKAYKALSIILKNCDGFLSANLEELLERMKEVLPSCHFSAKRHRLDCLYFLIVHVSKGEVNLERLSGISSLLTEIILSLKEANKKTRNRAYDLLVQIGHACGDEENGGREENLHQFFNTIAGGLTGETPHMISAAVTGLARLAYEFNGLVSRAYSLLPSAFLLFQRKNKEIIKANLGFLKVLVAKSQADGLQAHLESMVEGLLKWQHSTKNHFKAKVKHLLEMLVKKCGHDAVKAVMPEEHMKLLTNIRKIKERKERKASANSDSRSMQSKATTSRLSRWNHTRIFSKFGGEETDGSDTNYMDSDSVSDGRIDVSRTRSFNSKASSLRCRRARKAVNSLPEDLIDHSDEEPLDLLDRRRTRSSLRSSGSLKRKPESDDEPEIDSEGRLVIREGGKKPKRERTSSDGAGAVSLAGSGASNSSRKIRKRQKAASSCGWAYTGNEYASKKAGGDVKRKDKLEPYAYWPLDRKLMSRRSEHRAAARRGMGSVVKMAKKLEGRSASSVLSVKGLKHLKIQKKRAGKRK